MAKYLIQNIRDDLSSSAGSKARYMWTKITGTETNKTAYTDQAGLVPHTNPIEADAYGVFPQVWLSNDQEYRIRVIAQDGTTIFTDDDISGIGSTDATLRSDMADKASSAKGAGMSGYSAAVDYPDGTVGARLNESVSVKDYPFSAVGDGSTDDTAAIKAATESVGMTGSVVFPAGIYSVTSSGSYSTIACGRLVFERGAVLAPTPGSEFIIDAEVQAGNGKCFNVGKMVYACDCNAASTALRTWTYGFESSDVGKAVCLRYGGAGTGAAGVPNFVQNRLPFNTTISAYVSDSQVTLATGPTTAIRQDYVIDGGYSFLNTGIAIVGNGTVEFTEKVGEINAKWFGAAGDGAVDDAVALNKALQSVGRRHGGTKIVFPDGDYLIGRELKVDTGGCTLQGSLQSARFMRKASVALERMNMITAVWRGRYGGGGPTKAAEYWTFTGLSGSVSAPYWGGDWYITEGLVIDGLFLDGNKANQPALTPGTGIDAWDAGISLLYMKRARVTRCEFVNHLRWGIAYSTQSHDGLVEGCRFEACDEGAAYAETSNNIRFVNNHSENSPAAGWNMGAFTFLRITRGVIANNTVIGGNNGVYLRDLCNGIQVSNNVLDTDASYGIWLFDESLGSNVLLGIAITGNTIRSGTDCIHVEYCDRLSITGNVCNDPSRYGIYAAHSNYGSITGNTIYSAGTRDILIDAGTTYITAGHNIGNVELTGSSSTYITLDVPSGFTFTDSTSPAAGYLSVLDRPNLGDGNARHRFNGGVDLPQDYVYGGIRFGTYTIRPDVAAGKVRIKNGMPSSDTDGTVVGTQT